MLPYGRVLYDYKTDKEEKHPTLPGQPSAEKVLQASAMPLISPSYVGIAEISQKFHFYSFKSSFCFFRVPSLHFTLGNIMQNIQIICKVIIHSNPFSQRP